MTTEYVMGDNVVSMGPMRARTLFAALGRVETYWEALRDGRVMPARAEVDPRGIADVLEFAFVLERIAPGLARIRLAGMHLNELMAMEVRGMPVTAMFLPEARREMQRVLTEVMETPAVVRLTLGSDTGYSRPPLDAQMMLLPLRDAHGHPTRILGALQARGEIGRGPRRFMIRDIETKALLTDPLTAPRPDLSAYVDRPEPRPALHIAGDAEPEPGFARKMAALMREIEDRRRRNASTPCADAGTRDDDGRGPGHLRLVYDADLV